MNQNNIQASIDSIETFGLVDGPGIRVVVFFNGCKLRCKYCHNPEMWTKKENNYTPQELVDKIKKYKSYFKKNGGVTFSGGEPLLHSKFIIETAKLLKEENIHIALDTSGVGLGDYNELLPYIDLVILDIKHTEPLGYKELTNLEISEVEEFIKELFEACNEGKVVDYFIRYRKSNATERNSLFVKSVQEVAEGIIYKLKEVQMKAY